MKFFTKKSFLFKLIVAVCLCLSIFNFGMNLVVQGYGANAPDPTPVQGDGSSVGAVQQDPNHQQPEATGDSAGSFEAILGLGGKLLKPIIQLCTAIGDGIMNIIHKAIMGTESEIVVDTRTGFWAKVAGVLAGIVVIGVMIGLSILVGMIPVVGSIIVGAIGTMIVPLAIGTGILAYAGVDGTKMQEVTLLPLYTIGPEEIFKGNILLFDIDIFNPKEVYVKYGAGEEYNSNNTMSLTEWKSDKNKQLREGTNQKNISYFFFKDGDPGNTEISNIVVTSSNNTAYELKSVIAKWYYTIRNIALIGLMIVLLYVGIRILLTSTASEKAKYKEMLKDWIIGICLIFLLQYIMVFSTNFTESITTLLSSVAGETHHLAQIKNVNSDLKESIKDEFGEWIVGEDLNWYTNLMGKIRILAQEESGSTSYIGYALCFLVLVLYTIIFAFTYLKRVLYIMFLTIIAPLVALSYPLDKLRDGKAQAFDMWFKEYIFNLLIQPFHLLLYIVLISMAIDLSSTNIIYSLVALGFMMPAEKFLRKMFGFDRASTPGFLSGAAGAAVAMGAMNSLGKFANRGAGGQKGPKGMPKGKEDGEKADFLNRGADSGYTNSTLFSAMAAEKDELKDGNEGKKEEEKKNADTEDENKEPKQGEKELLDGAEGQEGAQEPIDETKRLTDNVLEAQALADDSDTTPYSEEEKQWAADNLANAQREIDEYNAKNAMKDGEEQANENAEEQKTPTFLGKAKNYLSSPQGKRMTGYVARKSLSTAAKTLGTGVRLSAGAAGGIMGAAAGIASGDLGSVIKNTSAGVYAGSALGQGTVNTAKNLGRGIYDGGKQTRDEIQKVRYGADYNQKMKEQKDAEFRKNKEMRLKVAQGLKLDEIKDKQEREKAIDKAMDQVIEYRKYGVTDTDITLKAMKMNEDNVKGEYNAENAASIDRIGAAKMASMTSSVKDLETNMKRFAATPGMSKTKVAKMDERVRALTGL